MFPWGKRKIQLIINYLLFGHIINDNNDKWSSNLHFMKIIGGKNERKQKKRIPRIARKA